MTRLDSQPWMSAPQTQKLMAALGEARFVGGAVRNALLGKPVVDVDIATPLTPDKVQQKLTAAGIRAVPTGIDHGTITAVVDGKPFEVTTLRRDVETDGRHAVVTFTTDWAEDARRRDFTMNALYADASGAVLDVVGGVEDMKAGRVRFVGDAATRIREDYLRILRLFRFHAWYGRGEIDAAALQAAAAEKAGIAKLSGERIAKEMLRLLEAAAPASVLRQMAASGILAEVLPDLLDIARLERLAEIDAANFFTPDAVLRLAALLPHDTRVAAQVSDRWKLSNAVRERLEDIAGSTEKIVSYLSIREVRKLLYRLGPQPFKDRLFLKWAEDPRAAMQWRALLAMADAWTRPRFPLTGRDVKQAGVPEGPLVGQVLGEVEAWWIDSDFTDDEFSLAERLKAVVQAVVY
ncbi:MAG: CCA tRNA nucleotidyltransferase [Alphaproteobacteria bacterium]|nr:CCA tRNA nucleotidyltransferase [Alphaproteobacteria bacterium]MDE1984931.1 CCA tRNA nucleotidyltransferase [Alphaproteobacteria bacterium]